jgi:hypothetical protein
MAHIPFHAWERPSGGRTSRTGIIAAVYTIIAKRPEAPLSAACGIEALPGC